MCAEIAVRIFTPIDDINRNISSLVSKTSQAAKFLSIQNSNNIFKTIILQGWPCQVIVHLWVFCFLSKKYNLFQNTLAETVSNMSPNRRDIRIFLVHFPFIFACRYGYMLTCVYFHACWQILFFSFVFFWRTRVHFHNFHLCCPSQRSARS